MTRRDRRTATFAWIALVLVSLLTLGLLLPGCEDDAKQATSTSSTPATTATTTAVAAPPARTLASGEDWVITETTRLSSLTIAEGATITPPEGKSVTLTVDGVETGQALATTAGYDLVFVPGTYVGDVVVTVADANLVDYTADASSQPVQAPFRQALYVDKSGVVETKSVLAAIAGQQPAATSAEDFRIASSGECFDGIFVAGSYLLKDVEIDFAGNARSDFSGYGAAVVGTGEGTTLVIDGADITTQGVARAAVVATGGANVIVKNSTIQTKNGELPADYAPTIDTTQMRSVPWMLGLSGNVRATNILGTNTKASYINSSISSEGWGVLSTDGCTTPILTAINSTIAITGDDGYGSYGIGNATEYFLGCTFDVATYATISRGSFLYYGDSDPEKVAKLNTELGLGLTAEELAAIPDGPTTVNSDRFGVMWHGGGTLDVGGGTVFNTKETTFLDKGQAITITVDGSAGAQLNPLNGVILQLMDDDDPGPDTSTMLNTGTYTEPTGTVAVDATHDLFTAAAADAVATFKNITLTGDFYNSTRGGAGAGASPGAPAGAGGAAAPGAAAGTAPGSTGGSAGTSPEGSGGATPPEGAGGTPPEGTPPEGAPPEGGAGGPGGTPPSGGTPPGSGGGTPPSTTGSVGTGGAVTVAYGGARLVAAATTTTTAAGVGTPVGATSGGAPGGTPPDGAAGGPEGAMPGAGGGSMNLVLTFDNSHLTGVISASTAVHQKSTITADDYRLLGTVTNTPSAAVNNGVIVTLDNGSTWTVTGTSYLTCLTVAEGCTVTAPAGKTLVMKVDGAQKVLAPGTYKGHIELTASSGAAFYQPLFTNVRLLVFALG